MELNEVQLSVMSVELSDAIRKVKECLIQRMNVKLREVNK